MTTASTPAFVSFLNSWQERVTQHYRVNLSPLTPPVLKVAPKGRKFIKIIAEDSSRRVMGFVAMGDGEIGGTPYRSGDILMPASWNAPAKHARGSIYDPSNGMDAVSVFGTNYL